MITSIHRLPEIHLFIVVQQLSFCLEKHFCHCKLPALELGEGQLPVRHLQRVKREHDDRADTISFLLLSY